MTTSPAEILATATAPAVKVCRECGATFTCEFAYAAQFVHVCGTCSDRHAADDQRRAIENSEQRRRSAWASVCPFTYAETDAKRLPLPHKLSEVMAWQYGPRGLLLHGPTGSGKSRCAWLLMRREYLAFRWVRVLGCDAGIEYAAKFGESTVAAARWIEKACDANLLLLDDTFKARLTDSFESALFTIIAKRGEAGLPIIVTSNDDPDSLAARMTQDRSAPLIRRLREMTRPIAFTK
ncbi:MAG: hypothetical protein EBS05_26705 [Proteobacteria bacterium]|nr:hypothetical protein [Pseudomonadota bacterium]